MPKLNWNWFWIVVLVTFMVVAVYVSVYTNKFGRMANIFKEKQIETCAIKPSTEPLLTKWVYEHSKQISRTGCKEVVQECLKTNKPLLIIALVGIESEYNQTAVSPKGATGLTQVMPGVWEKDLIAKGIIKERRDLFDIIPSVRAGDYVLSSCLVQSKGDVTKALELYLGGQDGYYVKRILSNLANLYILVEASK